MAGIDREWPVMSARRGSGSQVLSARQERAIAALLSAPSLGAAAHLAHVGERTLRRWLHGDHAFRDAYQAARHESLRFATARLQRDSVAAAETLTQVMGDEEISAQARIAAARSVLEFATKAFERDLEGRLEDLLGEVRRLQAMVLGSGAGEGYG